MIFTLIRRYERLLRYLVVGGGVAFFYAGLTAGLISWRLIGDRTLASLVGSMICIPLSFLVHSQTTYRDVAYDRAQWGRFGVLSLTTLAINTGLMKLSELLHWPYWPALVVGWVAVPAFNFVFNALWVFRTKTFLSVQR